jgi:4-amino-4-deoxy-L-arabinose transferase-like glycosyltransferase
MTSQLKRAAKVVELRPRESRSASTHARYRYDILLVIALLIGAAILRIDFIRASGFVIDGDEAIVGLMANHILHGAELPVFYYGQHYMGSLEPVCAALMFWLFGSSPFVLQLTPLLFSLALVVVMYALGREVGGQVVGLVAATLCAFPPVALVVWSYKARGGFIEVLVIGALATLFFVRWIKREPSRLGNAAGCALLLGVGWWVNNQIVYFIVPLGLFGVLYLVESLRSRRLNVLRTAIICFVSALCFFVGGAPYWVYNLRNGFPSRGMFGFAPIDKVGEYFVGLWTNALPILLGAKRFWEGPGSLSWSVLAVYVVYGCVLGGVLLGRKKEISRLMRSQVDRESQVELFFAIIFVACAVFCVSTFGWLSQAPRYLLPLYIPLFVICGVWVKFLGAHSRRLASFALVALVALNLASCFWGGRAIPGEPVVHRGERVSRDHTALIQQLEKLGITKVRTNYWIGYRLAFETDERVTFIVLQEPRQVRILEYQSLPEGMSQDLVPLLLVPSERSIFVGALNRLGYSFRETSADGYVVIYDIKRPSMDLKEIGRDAIAEVKATGAITAAAAVDGSIETRWATGAPQGVGQVFEVVFKVPQEVSAVRYQLGSWSQDYPRGLRIVGEDSAGNQTTLLTDTDYASLSIFFRGADFEFWFPPQTLKKVTLEQVGSHGMLDWSIAELSLYSGRVDLAHGSVAGGAR